MIKKAKVKMGARPTTSRNATIATVPPKQKQRQEHNAGKALPHAYTEIHFLVAEDIQQLIEY